MSEDEWEGWPTLGTRVWVPYGPHDLVGEIVAHRRLWITGTPVAEVRVEVPKIGDRHFADLDEVDDEYLDREERDRDDLERDEYAPDPYEPCGRRTLDVPMSLESLYVVAD